MAPNIARKAYSAEQLLALRHSASDETAIQIEAKARDGAIKGVFIFRFVSQLRLLALRCSPINDPSITININIHSSSPRMAHSFIQPTSAIRYHAFFPHATKEQPIIQSFIFPS
ncbi:hypothetical protein KCU77_g23106, partial [Aureobasidium melanogenum]